MNSLKKHLMQQFKKRLDYSNGLIEIMVSGGNVINTRSLLKPPATKEQIQRLINHFSSEFPPDYLQYLDCCNGASLFEDLQYGGENILYSVDQVILANDTIEHNGRIAIANICDDRILIDLNLWKKGEDQYLLLCESTNPVEWSGKFCCNFETWLERFLLAQGEKYWYWKTERV
jgi:hypothetical protein